MMMGVETGVSAKGGRRLLGKRAGDGELLELVDWGLGSLLGGQRAYCRLLRLRLFVEISEEFI